LAQHNPRSLRYARDDMALCHGEERSDAAISAGEGFAGAGQGVL